jgi:hypothetical protein
MLAALILFAAAPTYQFNCEYINSSTKGVIQSRQMVKGTLAMKSDHSGTWDHVSIAAAQGEAPFGEPAEQTYMDGFTFDPNDSASTKKSDFFKSFPPTAVQAENLVWDTQMFLQFAKRAPDTKLGTAIKFGSGDVNLAGSGTFTNKNVELTRLGSAKLSGVKCDLIKYDAFFNTIKMDLPGNIHLIGRSHYWGEFYVRANTTDFETGTLYEDVLGELSLPTGPQIINVLREGTFARVS